MPDREREIIAAAAAIARLLRANPGADPEVLAREIVMVLYDPPHGWRKSIYEAPAWAHRGTGLPTQDSEAATLLARVRAEVHAAQEGARDADDG